MPNIPPYAWRAATGYLPPVTEDPPPPLGLPGMCFWGVPPIFAAGPLPALPAVFGPPPVAVPPPAGPPVFLWPPPPAGPPATADPGPPPQVNLPWQYPGGRREGFSYLHNPNGYLRVMVIQGVNPPFEGLFDLDNFEAVGLDVDPSLTVREFIERYSGKAEAPAKAVSFLEEFGGGKWMKNQTIKWQEDRGRMKLQEIGLSGKFGTTRQHAWAAVHDA